MERPQQTRRVTILSMGNAEVGKSCLIKRYCEQKFIARYSPTQGIDYGEVKSEISGIKLSIKICDLSGNPYFYHCRNEFYETVHGAFLVYDVTNRNSFVDLEMWLTEMKQHAVRDISETAFVVCAHKVDIASRKKRAVTEAEGRHWAGTHCFPYFETSSVSGQSISEAFKTMLDLITRCIDGKGKPRVAGLNQAELATLAVEPSSEQKTAVDRMMNGKNAFEKFGLSHSASREDVSKQYRKLAMLLHPDKNPHTDADEAFKLLAATKKELLLAVSS